MCAYMCIHYYYIVTKVPNRPQFICWGQPWGLLLAHGTPCGLGLTGEQSSWWILGLPSSAGSSWAPNNCPATCGGPDIFTFMWACFCITPAICHPGWHVLLQSLCVPFVDCGVPSATRGPKGTLPAKAHVRHPFDWQYHSSGVLIIVQMTKEISLIF